MVYPFSHPSHPSHLSYLIALVIPVTSVISVISSPLSSQSPQLSQLPQPSQLSPSPQLPPGQLGWESAGLLSGRSRVYTPARATFRVFKKLRRKCCLCNDICKILWLDFLQSSHVRTKNHRSLLTAVNISGSCGT